MDARLAQEFFKLRAELTTVLDDLNETDNIEVAETLMTKFTINFPKEQ